MKQEQEDRSGLRLLPGNADVFLMTAVQAVAAGLTVVAFIFLAKLVFAGTFMVLAARSKTVFVLGSLGVVLASSLLAGALIHLFAPEAGGSGIPQMKAAYWKELGRIPAGSAVIKFLAGVISIGGGTSLGWEGPSVFMGSAVASNLSALGNPGRRERRGPALAGASAGLASAFNAPLAAITFAMEEVTGELNSKYMGGVVLASVLGSFTVYALLGRHPAYSLPSVENVSWLHYMIVPLVAFVCALAGVAFQKGSLFLRKKTSFARDIPIWLQPSFGGLITWTLGVAVFLVSGKLGVFGVGYQDLSAALRNDFPWKVAGIMFAAKLLATIASYGFGCCGGIFAPLLLIGGMGGYCLAGLVGTFMPLSPADHIVLAAVGMSACLGAVIKAPLTSLLMVFEMTHQFALVPGLLLGAIISQATARLAGRMNLDDALLVQAGHELHKIRPPKDLESWRRLPVSAIANPRPVVLTGLTADHLKAMVRKYPFNVFPVVIDGRLEGIVSRKAIADSLSRHGSPPDISRVVTCLPDQTVGEIGDKFIESPVNVLVVVDRDGGKVVGIITLHDLIRAQAAMAE